MLESTHRNKTIYSDVSKSIQKMADCNYIKSYTFVVSCEKRILGVILIELRFFI